MDTMTSHTTYEPWHHNYSELMSLALDDMLRAEEERQLDQHLAACPACRTVWFKWRRVARVLTVEPFAGPPQGFTLNVDHALQRDERRQERIWAGLVLAGGTLTILALVVLGTALTTALWMAVSSEARLQAMQTLSFASQFMALIFQNLASVRDAVLALLPSPVFLLIVALAMMTAGVIWVRLVFYGAQANSPGQK
jgi:predicted anti-sigma-YlaC factor YlaD